jgi:DNA ligase-1
VSDYIIHKAIEVKKLAKRSELAGRLKHNPRYLEENFIAQPKHDGCNCVIGYKEGRLIFAKSRTGEDTVAIGPEHAAFLKRVDAPDGVYLGEAWDSQLPFHEISGIFRRKTPDPQARLQHIVFDFLTWEEWEQGYSNLSYMSRVARLGGFLSVPHAFKLAPIHPIVGFGVLAHTWPAATGLDIANKLQAAGGYDGLVFRDPDGLWHAGDNGTNGEIIKVKPLLRVTCEVTGYIPGEGKYQGLVGSLLISYKGQEQGAGTGLKDHQRDQSEFQSRWKGKLVEIEALGETPDGRLREPRLLGIRSDVLEAD